MSFDASRRLTDTKVPSVTTQWGRPWWLMKDSLEEWWGWNANCNELKKLRGKRKDTEHSLLFKEAQLRGEAMS